MALQLSVSQSGGKLRVCAGNYGDHVVIIDHINLVIEGGTWTWIISKYQEDFYFGSGRISTQTGGLMFEMNYSSGPANVHATAHYFEVDQTVESPTINVS